MLTLNYSHGSEDAGVNMQVISHNALSEALARTQEVDSYAQSPLWNRADDVDSMGDNDFEQQKVTHETDFEDTAVTHYENYDTIGMRILEFI